MFTGYITRLRDNYPVPVLVAWELVPQHYLDKMKWWLPSHTVEGGSGTVAYINVSPMSPHRIQLKGPLSFICCFLLA